ncbi:hypothetical protein D9M68_766710 [compost metagenome]
MVVSDIQVLCSRVREYTDVVIQLHITNGVRITVDFEVGMRYIEEYITYRFNLDTGFCSEQIRGSDIKVTVILYVSSQDDREGFTTIFR